MEAVLKFDLNDVDDRMAHLRCIKATDMAVALFEIKYNLLRHGGFDDAEDIDKIGEKISAIFDENGINIDELIN